MTGYPAIRVSAKPRRCYSNGCHIEQGEKYLRTFYPPEGIYSDVYVSHRCERCATLQGHGEWFAVPVPASS